MKNKLTIALLILTGSAFFYGAAESTLLALSIKNAACFCVLVMILCAIIMCLEEKTE